MANAFRSCCLASALVAVVGCGGGGGGGGGGTSSAAGALCNELVSCQQLPSSMLSMCVESFDVYVPDPVAAKACIDGKNLSCSDVQTSNQILAVANACLFDTSKFACVASTTPTLNICSPATTGHPSQCKNQIAPTAENGTARKTINVFTTDFVLR